MKTDNTVKTIIIVEPRSGSEAMQHVATSILYDLPAMPTHEIIDRLMWAFDSFVRLNGGWNINTPNREVKTLNWFNHIIEQARRPDDEVEDYVIDDRVRETLKKYCWNLHLYGEGMGENLRSR